VVSITAVHPFTGRYGADVMRRLLAPLAHYYCDPFTVEIRMNRPQQLITEQRAERAELGDPLASTPSRPSGSPSCATT
jgi:hypothetical protein